MSTLLNEGLAMTVLGLGIVFACLGLLWGFMALLTRLLPARSVEPSPVMDDEAHESVAAMVEAEAAAAAELTAERARVAALVAGALMANAIPILLDVPTGPVFEHGRTAPCWVSANRTRTLEAWQPPRTGAE